MKKVKFPKLYDQSRYRRLRLIVKNGHEYLANCASSHMHQRTLWNKEQKLYQTYIDVWNLFSEREEQGWKIGIHYE